MLFSWIPGSPNPFKAQQPVANPFQASGNPNVQMFQSNGPVAPQPVFGFNSNGFTNGNNFGGSCGFGFGAMQPQQPIAATGMGTFSNPFAVGFLWILFLKLHLFKNLISSRRQWIQETQTILFYEINQKGKEVLRRHLQQREWGFQNSNSNSKMLKNQQLFHWIL